MLKKTLISIIIISIFLNISFVFAQGVPDNLDQAKEAGEMVKKIAIEESPNILKQTWNDISGLFKTIWNSYLFPWLKIIWNKIVSILGKEVEQRRPEIEEEFRKETQEMKEDIPKVTKSLWQRFKELISTD